MKLTMAFLLIAAMHVSAKGLGQERITLKMNETEIKKVLFAIEKKSSYRFLFNENVLKGKPRVTVDVVDALLQEVLDKMLEHTGVGYKILSSNLVVLKETTEDKAVDAPEIRVSGKVTSESGEPLLGVTVNVKGSSIGTTSDGNGNYSITVPDEAVLVFSYVGFIAVEERVAGRSVINITLKFSKVSLEQVVIVGYGTQKKRDLTGTISSVNGEELAKLPSTNPISSLQGKIPGLTVSNSGRAGSSPVVRIRGINSTNSASPVYVVDGILQDNIDYLNPADIESIDVLKDPSSIAIYGLRGANGVIAVTLKKAARGKTVINLQSYVGIQKVANKIELVDAAGFKKLYNQQLANANTAPFDYTNYTANTDWQDEIFRTAVINSNNLSISNSGEKTTTYLNIGYTTQEGVEKYDSYQRYLVRLNEEIRITNKIKVGGDFTGYHFTSNPPPGNVITNALWAAPIVPVKTDTNTYYAMPSFQRAQVGNPIANIDRNNKNSVDKGYRVLGSLFVEIKFLQNFIWRSTVYTDLIFNVGRSYTRLPFRVIYLGEGATQTTTYFDTSQHTTVGQSQSESRKFQQDHTLAFDKKLGHGHNLNVLVGFTTVYNANSTVGASRRDIGLNVPDNPDYWYVDIVNSATNPIFNNGSGSENSQVGSFARVSYSYLGKYLVNATIRRDGSSKFAPQNRWGTFGSVGLGWVLTDEDFFKQIKEINFLKIRGAWGRTGNANGFADNLWLPGVQTASNAVFGDNVYSSVQTAYVPSPDLHWETVQGIDVGFDLRALRNRLNAEVTFYNRTTSDILTSITLPNLSIPYFDNLGEISNKGIEVNLGWNDKIGSNLTYSVSGNFSYNKNVVKSIGDKFNFQITGNGGVNLTNTGKSIGYFYGYQQIGIYQSTADLAKQPALSTSLPGDVAYADINGDGVITSADRTYLGSPFPPYSFGGNISVGYKNFDLLIEGQGFAGHKIYTQRRTANFTDLNFEANRLNAWTSPGISNIEPVIDKSRGNNYLMSTYYLEPGDFFRIRTVQIGYNFSSKMLGSTIKSARIYLSGQNIKTWSKVTGYSPEPIINSILGGGADNGSYPVPAVYTFGINIGF